MPVFDRSASHFRLDWRLGLGRGSLALGKHVADDRVPRSLLLISGLLGVLWLKLHEATDRALACEILRIFLAYLKIGALGRRTFRLRESDRLLDWRCVSLRGIFAGLPRNGGLFYFEVGFLNDLLCFLLHLKNLLFLQTLSSLNILSILRNDNFLGTHHLRHWCSSI